MKGNGHIETLDFHAPPSRVVSLVPSMTDSLYELGAGSSLVGVTEYCPVPIGIDKPPALVGGTKTADPKLIKDLAPDLIIANQEENRKDTVEALEAEGLPVWVTFPTSVHGALELLHTLVRLFRLKQAVSRLQTLEITLDWAARSAPMDIVRVFCPIWYQAEGEFGPWWMVFNLIDGRLISWHGTRMARALAELPELLEPAAA